MIEVLIAVVVPFLATIVAVAVRQEFVVRKANKIYDEVNHLVKMHEQPEKYGFGTVETNRVLRDAMVSLNKAAKQSENTTTAIRELIHYMLWDIRNKNGGKSPPPPPPHLE